VVVAHDRHLLRLVTNDLWLIDDGRLRPFDGDLDDYVNWLRHRQKGTENPNDLPSDEKSIKRKGVTIKPKQNIQPSKSTRQERAQQRIKVKPLRDKLDRIENEIDKATEVQQELDRQLADSEIYNEANRSQLRELLFDQARNAQLQQELEGRWLAASELLEQADVPA
jgi:ATP-binding cassette subfamily F protein 3